MSKLIEGIDYKIEGKILFINESVEEIPDEAFKNDRRFLTLVCPSTLKYIGKYAFNGCIIENILLNDGLEYIDVDAFGSNSFSKLIIPDSVYYIANHAFGDNINLEELKLSNSLGVIQMHTFSGCRNLKTLVIPESVKVIEKYAFLECDITDSIIPDSVMYNDVLSFHNNANYYKSHPYKEYNNVLANSSDNDVWTYGSIKKVMKRKDYYIDVNRLFINEGVEIIPPYAFKDKDITDIVFPSTLKIISHNAFENCKMYGVTFPKSLIYIGKQAFFNCKNLRHINFNNGLLAIEEQAFSMHQATEIELPESLVYLERNALFINSYYSDKTGKGFVKINPENIKCIDFTGNNLSNVDVLSYPTDAYIAYTEYKNRKRQINDFAIFNEKSTFEVICTIVENNRKKIANVSEIESSTIGKIIKLQVDNYLLNKDKYISEQALTNVIESLILSGGNINHIDQKGTPLIEYLYYNNLVELVKLLLKYGADINACDTNGISMLMYSIKKDDASMFNTLLKLDCDVNLRDINGNTALIYAIRSKNIEFIKLLIDKNAYINITNNSNQSALDISKETECKEIIDIFKCQDEEVNPNIEEAREDLMKLSRYFPK